KMLSMFKQTKAFNQPLDKWNVSNVVDMRNMFYDARAFNQSLGNWNLKNIPVESYVIYGFRGIIDHSGLDCNNYYLTLKGWAENPDTPCCVTFETPWLEYPAEAIPYRNKLIEEKKWLINRDKEVLCDKNSN
ncbi:MAG: BspA family leucine-rich repeat surface protein, partial [Myroides sp.]